MSKVSLVRLLVVTGILAPNAALTEEVVSTQGARTRSDIERFCTNVVDEVRERRYAEKRAELEALLAEVNARLALLDKRNGEIERWVRLRDGFVAQAEESLVGIYGSMRPDAAAARMEKLAPDLAAALLLKLPPRVAGVILNEMDAARAASITNVMVAAADRKGS